MGLSGAGARGRRGGLGIGVGLAVGIGFAVGIGLGVGVGRGAGVGLRRVLAAVSAGALLAGCAIGQGGPTAGPTSSAAAGTGTHPGASPSSRVAGVSTTVGTPAGTGGRTGTTTAHRPSAQDARDTVRAYMRREIGMTDPVTSPLRWTGADTGEIDVRARLPIGSLGPVTVVSVRRLQTVWFVIGARTSAIRVDTPAAPISSSVRVKGRAIRPEGDLLVRVTQDRYGTDVELGRGVVHVVNYRQESPSFSSAVTFRAATAGTGSLVVTEQLPRAAGNLVLRATVVRVRFAPPRATSGPSCAPATFLKVVKPAMDDPAGGPVVDRVDVQRCRNGYADIHVVPRNDPKSANQYDTVEMILQFRNGGWHSLDYGSDIGCDSSHPTSEVLAACRALGYRR